MHLAEAGVVGAYDVHFNGIADHNAFLQPGARFPDRVFKNLFLRF